MAASDEAQDPLRVPATWVRHNRWWLALGALPYAAIPALAIAAAVTGKAAFLAPIAHALIFGTLFFWTLYRANKNPRLVRGALVITPSGALEHEGVRIAAPGEIARGFVIGAGSEPEIVLYPKGSSLARRFRVGSVAEGRSILRRLGVDASQTVVELSAMSRAVVSGGKTMFAFGAFIASLVFAAHFLSRLFHAPFLAPALIGPSVLVMGGMAAARTRVRIGTDGIVTRWLGRSRRLPFSEITDVRLATRSSGTKHYRGVELELGSGEVYWLPCHQARWSGNEADILYERIREAREVYASGGGAWDTSVLARRGRAAREWLTSLLAIGAGADADMRRAPVRSEHLFSILEDAKRSGSERAAAAIALSSRATPADRTRIRIAADTTVSEDLKRVLERASESQVEPEEEATQEALSAMEAAEEETARRERRLG